MIDINVDAGGQPMFTSWVSWVPLKNDFESANEIYIDENHKAAI
jgi:hypothetical protein